MQADGMCWWLFIVIIKAISGWLVVATTMGNRMIMAISQKAVGERLKSPALAKLARKT